MLTKIYPEWSGYKEGLNVIDTWTCCKTKKTNVLVLYDIQLSKRDIFKPTPITTKT